MSGEQNRYAVIAHRRHRCAGSIWTAEFDSRGQGRAAFCGHRSRRVGDPQLVRETSFIVERLGEDLWTHRHRRSLRWVWLSPGADPFVPGARDLVEPTLACARTLLERSDRSALTVDNRVRSAARHRRREECGEECQWA